MSIPEKGDPRRPIALAANAARVLGVLCVLAALLVAGLALVTPRGVRGGMVTYVMFGLSAVYLTPGVLFLVFASQVKVRRKWAAVGLIVLGGITALFAGLGTFGAALQLSRGPAESSAVLTGQMVGVGFVVLVLVSSILLVVYASQSIRAIDVLRNTGEGGPMGFQPVMSPYAPHPYYGASPYAPPPAPGGPGQDDRSATGA